MRIVLDASVLIAAIARPGVCTELVEEVARDHTLVLSEFILAEVERKLREKFGVPAKDAAALATGIRGRGEVVTPVPVPRAACRDSEDLPILGTAVGGQAKLLVTVDKDLLTLGEFQGIPVVKPGEFWRRL
ncbi:MAG: putative toxin-antitoxin system toxin component, PIN family [Verrucomicrobiales bacterium]|nr:putative toxin-antitoxin system toxin component, PIN family [Verrucomicrobiales bacterium]